MIGAAACYALSSFVVKRYKGLTSVTVITGDAWRAEVLAKAAFVAGADGGRALVEGAGATGLLVTDGGEVVELEGLDRFRP